MVVCPAYQPGVANGFSQTASTQVGREWLTRSMAHGLRFHESRFWYDWGESSTVGLDVMVCGVLSMERQSDQENMVLG